MRILITGAAGLLGGEVTARLLHTKHAVVALTHQHQTFTDNDGNRLKSRHLAQGFPAAGELSHIAGNIADANLGLPDKLKTKLAQKTDLIVHCAALTDFDADPESYQAVNVNGTENLLKLSPNIPFLHVSTAYVCGERQNFVGEAHLPADRRFTNGYEVSKALAEQCVREASNPSVIVRPSIIVGNHGNGRIGSFDNFYILLKLMAEGRIRSIPTAASASFDFVPIDHVVGGIMDIIAHWGKTRGEIFHLTSGGGIKATQLATAMALVSGIHTPKLLAGDQFDETLLSPQERRIHRKFLHHYLPYFRPSPAFENKALMELSGRKCPRMDLAAMRRQIQYCIDSGFIAPVHLPESA